MAKIADSTSPERVPVKVDLPKALDRAMEVQAAKLDISKREFVENALREYLDRMGALTETAA